MGELNLRTLYSTTLLLKWEGPAKNLKMNHFTQTLGLH